MIQIFNPRENLLCCDLLPREWDASKVILLKEGEVVERSLCLEAQLLKRLGVFSVLGVSGRFCFITVRPVALAGGVDALGGRVADADLKGGLASAEAGAPQLVVLASLGLRGAQGRISFGVYSSSSFPSPWPT